MKGMSSSRVSWFFLLFCLLIPSFAAAQKPASGKQSGVYQSGIVVRSNTRLVILDVVAADKEGRPVSDLTADDFKVVEAGQPQRISDFTAHRSEPTSVTAQPLAPGVVSNTPHFKSSSLNVILFDAANGDFAAHAYAKDELLKFLATAKLDRPIAVFVLESKLKMLHDFTTDMEPLLAAVKKYRFPVAAQTTQSMESRISAFGSRGDFHTNDRTIQTTLNQLNVLAKVLSGYPGRKNLIWLSESFPVDLFPDIMTQTSMGGADLRSNEQDPSSGGLSVKQITENEMAFTDYAALIKKVSDALLNAQVAVYPVDAGALGKDDHLAAQHTMNDMAARTGGRAFINSNDLTVSMRTSIEDGSTYYTLEYYPSNKKWDGQFRAIHVTTSRPGVRLRYREGYYALDPEKLRKEENEKVADDFSHLLQVDAPAATAVRFQAGVVPPSDKNKKVTVNFAIDPHSIAFENKDGLEHAKVSCTVWAYKGKDTEHPKMSEGDTVTAAMKPDVYQKLMAQYFPCKRELSLQSGTYTLKMGVIDRTTNFMGTATAMVTVP
jgi:VWFA-related protein